MSGGAQSRTTSPITRASAAALMGLNEGEASSDDEVRDTEVLELTWGDRASAAACTAGSTPGIRFERPRSLGWDPARSQGRNPEKVTVSPDSAGQAGAANAKEAAEAEAALVAGDLPRSGDADAAAGVLSAVKAKLCCCRPLLLVPGLAPCVAEDATKLWPPGLRLPSSDSNPRRGLPLGL